MDLNNLQVKHKVFGLGTVTATNGKYMTIRFDSVEKNFVYPDSFEKFLTLADGTVSDEIRHDLDAAAVVKQQILDKKMQENIHSMTHGIVIPGKESLTDSEDEEPNYKSTDNEEV